MYTWYIHNLILSSKVGSGIDAILLQVATAGLEVGLLHLGRAEGQVHEGVVVEVGHGVPVQQHVVER